MFIKNGLLAAVMMSMFCHAADLKYIKVTEGQPFQIKQMTVAPTQWHIVHPDLLKLETQCVTTNVTSQETDVAYCFMPLAPGKTLLIKNSTETFSKDLKNEEIYVIDIKSIDDEIKNAHSKMLIPLGVGVAGLGIMLYQQQSLISLNSIIQGAAMAGICYAAQCATVWFYLRKALLERKNELLLQQMPHEHGVEKPNLEPVACQ